MVVPILATFCTLFGRLISTLHDGEFCQEDVLPGAFSKIMPFTLTEIVSVSSILKDISLGLVDLAFPETKSSINDHYKAALTFSQKANETVSAVNKAMWPHLLKVIYTCSQQFTRKIFSIFLFVQRKQQKGLRLIAKTNLHT